MKPGTRRRVHSCATPNTYKYFIASESVEGTWNDLRQAFGDIRRLAGFNLRQIDASSFVLRSVDSGNPITVVPKRNARDEDFVLLHKILKFTQEIRCNE